MQAYHLIDIRKDFVPKKDWAVFFDRDGVFIEERHLVHKLKDFKMIEGSARALKKLNLASIPVFLIHNGSVVARGLCNEDQVVKLNLKLKQELEKFGSYLDGLLFCPHRKEAYNRLYDHNCDWRKPGTGMLKFISKLFKIDLKKSFIVGDSFRDVELGENSGSSVLLVKTGHAGQDGDIKKYRYREFLNLSEAVDYLLKKKL